MRVTSTFALSLLACCILFSVGCRKTDQPVKMGQVQDSVCDPIRLFSAPVDETYIVILRSADSETGTVQTMSRATTAASTIFSRHSIPENQRFTVLNRIH